jgi:hypothetical protein
VAMETRQSLIAEFEELKGGIAFNVERRMEISSAPLPPNRPRPASLINIETPVALGVVCLQI